MATESSRAGGAPAYRFRVSDALDVPLRGCLLRLRLLEGSPKVGDLEPGKEIRLRAPDGAERTVRIKALSVTGGAVTQERFEWKRELDIVISDADCRAGGRAVEIGWEVVGR